MGVENVLVFSPSFFCSMTGAKVIESGFTMTQLVTARQELESLGLSESRQSSEEWSESRFENPKRKANRDGHKIECRPLSHA